MADYLAIIQKIIDEHKKFKEHIRLIGDTISDREALSGLEKARTALMPSQLENLAQKQEKLQQLLSVLDEGLSRQELEHKQKVEFLYTEVAFPQTDGG